MTPPTSKCPPLAAQPCARLEASMTAGWQEVLARCGSHHPMSPACTLPHCPISAWMFGRCCTCLAHGHRAAVCRDPLRCSRCFENGHRVHEFCNRWRPLSLLACLAASLVSHLDGEHHHGSCVGVMGLATSSMAPCCMSWVSVVSAPIDSVLTRV
jgi:hypothetical protein